MTIHLPEDVESSITAEVLGGQYPSADDAVAEIVRAYFQRRQKHAGVAGPASQEPPAPPHRPIWEEIQEITAIVPDEVWDTLPPDLSAEHDHYIYGTPKR